MNISSGFIAPFSDTLTGKHSEDSLHVEDYDVKTSIDTSGNGTWADKQREDDIKDDKEDDIEKDQQTSNTGNLTNNSNNKNSQVYESNKTSSETGSGTRGQDETEKKKGSNIWNNIKTGASNIWNGVKNLASNLNPFKKK